MYDKWMTDDMAAQSLRQDIVTVFLSLSTIAVGSKMFRNFEWRLHANGSSYSVNVMRKLLSFMSHVYQCMFCLYIFSHYVW